jgi:molybdenum cofactor synthesis domain-containing protein
MTSKLKGSEIIVQEIVSDDQDQIREKLIHYCDDLKVNVVLTTGGTGFSPTDLTPEATYQVLERAAPGIAEALRAESIKKTHYGMLSRGVAGIRKSTLIVNLPGSPKGVKENLSVLLKVLPHAVELMQGKQSNHD